MGPRFSLPDLRPTLPRTRSFSGKPAVALRTTAPKVADILGRDYEEGRSLTGFIQTANVLVDRVNTDATARGFTLSSAELELIERWLAAHFYAQSDRTYAENMTGNASAVFAGKTGMYLESTLYGQTAVRLDPSGALAAIASEQLVVGRFLWAGKPPSEQTSYDQRD